MSKMPSVLTNFGSILSAPPTDTFIRPIASKEGGEGHAFPILEPHEQKARQEILKQIDGLPEGERRRVLRKLIAQHERDRKKAVDEKNVKLRLLDSSVKTIDAVKEIIEWSEKPAALEKCEESRFSEFRKSLATGHVRCFDKSIETELPSKDYEKEVMQEAEVFIIQHDWAAAFDKAQDFSSAPFRLPYDVCAFEFQMSGRRIIALATGFAERVVYTPVLESSKGWVLYNFVYSSEGDKWVGADVEFPLADIIGKQIRAVCIALDAEIARTDVQREKHTGTSLKNTFAPLKSFHIVSLVRKPRPLSRESSEPTGRQRRLHFRRGHWRHFSTFKTWVKWCLVGNPDLGFIDKHYKL